MIDLHIHTNHSDGTDSVEELLHKAEEKKLEIISITDHDQIGAYIEIEKIKLYYTTDLKQNDESLDESLVEFVKNEETGKYKVKGTKIKLLD